MRVLSHLLFGHLVGREPFLVRVGSELVLPSSRESIGRGLRHRNLVYREVNGPVTSPHFGKMLALEDINAFVLDLHLAVKVVQNDDGMPDGSKVLAHERLLVGVGVTA
jgi:hypothetical protein